MSITWEANGVIQEIDFGIDIVDLSTDTDIVDLSIGAISFENPRYVYPMSSAATWTVANPFGGPCRVDVYIGDELVYAEVNVTTVNVSVVFPSPQSGTMIIS